MRPRTGADHPPAGSSRLQRFSLTPSRHGRYRDAELDVEPANSRTGDGSRPSSRPLLTAGDLPWLAVAVLVAVGLRVLWISHVNVDPNDGRFADTVFFLSDGRPYVPNVGQRPGDKRKAMPDPNHEILAAVRRWNPYRRLVVHAVGLGLTGGRFEQQARSFLQKLAAQNGGRFVERK